MMISVIIVPTHVPINVVQVIVYFKISSELEYNVEITISHMITRDQEVNNKHIIK